MLQLYYSPGACSLAVHAVLHELGLPVELKKTDLSKGEGQSPDFLKLNPRGQVPVLVEDGMAIREGGAILIYLLDKHNSPLLPQSGPERTRALEWLMWCNASLHPAYGRAFWLAFKAEPKDATQAEFLRQTCAMIEKMWAEADAHLSTSPYLAGSEVSAADFLMTVFANWNGYFSHPIKLGENVKRVIRNVAARPSFQKALAAENVEYKAAAA